MANGTPFSSVGELMFLVVNRLLAAIRRKEAARSTRTSYSTPRAPVTRKTPTRAAATRPLVDLTIIAIASIVVATVMCDARIVDSMGRVFGCHKAALCCQGKNASCYTMGRRVSSLSKLDEEVTIADETNLERCYCDDSCRLTKDCCDDHSSACRVQNCEVSSWGPWSDCRDSRSQAQTRRQHACGADLDEARFLSQRIMGVRTRSRYISNDGPKNGGKTCPALKQSSVCFVSRQTLQRQLYKLKARTDCIRTRSAEVLSDQPRRSTGRLSAHQHHYHHRTRPHQHRRRHLGALYEKAKLLPAWAAAPTPGTLATSGQRHYGRYYNIRKNLFEKDIAEGGVEKPTTYCARYKIVSVTKGCGYRDWTSSLSKPGHVVCVECQPQPQVKATDLIDKKHRRRHAESRMWCKGDGVLDERTRFSALLAYHCHGTWVKLESQEGGCAAMRMCNRPVHSTTATNANATSSIPGHFIFA